MINKSAGNITQQQQNKVKQEKKRKKGKRKKQEKSRAAIDKAKSRKAAEEVVEDHVDQLTTRIYSITVAQPASLPLR
jgi:hypothetical protein